MSFQHDPGVYWYSWPEGQSLENFIQTNALEVITSIVDSVLDDLDSLLSEESDTLREAERVVEKASRTLCDSLEDVAGPERETRDLTRCVLCWGHGTSVCSDDDFASPSAPAISLVLMQGLTLLLQGGQTFTLSKQQQKNIKGLQ